MARARMSVVPPGAKGTMIFTGLVGQLALWAQAEGVAMKVLKAVSAVAKRAP
jgi:hypothetical protein